MQKDTLGMGGDSVESNQRNPGANPADRNTKLAKHQTETDEAERNQAGAVC